MQRELDQLAPVFEASKTDVQLRQEAVEACQKEYAAAKETCKKQEQDIEFMQGPIEILKREAQAEFEKVSNLLFYSWRVEFLHELPASVLGKMSQELGTTAWPLLKMKP